MQPDDDAGRVVFARAVKLMLEMAPALRLLKIASMQRRTRKGTPVTHRSSKAKG
jgi:hypothetical protein